MQYLCVSPERFSASILWHYLGASRVTNTDKGREPEEQGALTCPICGSGSPHYHSPEEPKQRSELEAWIEEIWQDFCESMMPVRPC
jgi:hypothetical protein